MLGGNPTHHYCDVYDSLQQAENVSWGDPPNRYYLGRLRLDTLLARKTIIKDAELLNGIFFLSATESEDFFKSMPLEKIEIRSRSANLEEALVGLFVRPSAENLRGIILHALPFEEANEVRRQLETIPSTRVTDRQSLCRVLKEKAGIDRTCVDRLDQAWRKWIDFSTSHKLNIAIWDPFDFNAELSSQLDRIKDDTILSLETERGKDLAERVYKDRFDRGLVVEHVREAKRQANETERKDIATLSSWHGAAYNRSVAVHHNCGMLEITDDPDSRPIGLIRKHFDVILEELYSGTAPNVPAQITANISPAFLEALSTYSKGNIDGLIKKHENNLNAWHNTADFSRLARAVNELVEEVDKVEGFKDAGKIPGWFASTLKFFTREAGGEGKRAAVTGAVGAVGGGVLGGVIGIFVGAATAIAIDKGIESIVRATDKRAGASRRIVERAAYLKKQGSGSS